jgi:hypothetical protein
LVSLTTADDHRLTFATTIGACETVDSHMHDHRIIVVMVSLLASGAVYHVFETRSSQTKDYKIDMWCFSAK